MTEDLRHLTDSAQATAMLPDEERIRYIHGDRWINYPRAQQALNRLEEFLTWPKKARMPNLLIIGPTNNGKTKIVEKFKRDHLVKIQKGKSDQMIPIVVVQIPTEPTVARFYETLLTNIGAPHRPHGRVIELEPVALRLLRSLETKMLVLDELHNILAAPPNVRRNMLTLIRYLGNDLRIPIVGVGTKDAYIAIRSDEQLENRFEPQPLPIWEAGDELRSLIASFAAVLPLKRPSKIATEKMSAYILARTDGTIGEIAKFLSAAGIAAVTTGEECINRKTLEAADYQSPSQRRRTFERT